MVACLPPISFPFDECIFQNTLVLSLCVRREQVPTHFPLIYIYICFDFSLFDKRCTPEKYHGPGSNGTLKDCGFQGPC